MKPIILSIKIKKDRAALAQTRRKKPYIVDEIEEQLKELEFVRNPRLLLNPKDYKRSDLVETIWVYYPWKNVLVHCLNEKDFKYLRTSRNQNLITKDEQN